MTAPERDAHLLEQGLGGETLLAGGFLEVRRDRVRLPDGREATREYVRHPGAVAIVPLRDDGQLVLVRQHRYPVGRILLEWPAGKLDAGEDTRACAARELREETGYAAAEWAFGGEIHNAAAYSSESIWIWFARGLRAGAQQLDAGEFVEVIELPEPALAAMAADGRLTDVKTLIGLQMLQQWRAGLRALDWRAAA